MADKGKIESLALVIQKNAAKYPELPVLTFENGVHPDEVLTFSELEKKGNRLACHMTASGIKPGDTVTVIMKNHPEIVLALYATALIGAVLVTLDPLSSWDKLGYLLQHANTKGVIFSADLTDTMQAVLSALPNIRVLGVRTRNHPDFKSSDEFPDLDRITETAWLGTPEPPNHSGQDHLMTIYTPGTTGIPKGVVIDGHRLQQQTVINRDVWKYKTTDVLYTCLPMAYGNAWAVALFPALMCAIPTVISHEFPGIRVWDICRKYSCNIFACFGGWLADLFALPETAADKENPVETVISSNTPEKIWKSFEKRFDVRIHEWYFTLEGGIAHNPPGEGPCGSMGRPLDSCFEMKMVNENGEIVHPDETGELLIRSIEATSLNNVKDVQTHSGQNWIRTGDLVHSDTDGWLFFHSRKKNRLKSHGEFITAREIEEVLIKHPQIRDVVVFGIDKTSGPTDEQDAVAGIIPEKENPVDIQGIFSWCRDYLNPETVPVYIQVIGEIPKTGTAKILHRRLMSDFEVNDPNVYFFKDYLW